jgi:cytochrome c-type biogenesis protein CcmH/NrfG
MGQASGANPHGTDAQTGMPDIEGLKAKLDANPLDLESLATLYQTYGMIGRSSQMRSYLDTALEEIEAQQETLGDKLAETGRGVAIAALLGGDAEGAIVALNKVQELVPEDLESIQLLAEVYYSIDEPAEAIEWYSLYLDSADAATAGEQYASARASRAKMQIRLFELSEGDQANRPALDAGVTELEAVVAEDAENFSAWLQLGKGYGLQNEITKAEAAYETCLDLAMNEQEYWQAEAALAELHGEEPPEQPAQPGGMGSMMGNPHGGMGSGSNGMGANPHGGMGANPHGSMGGGEAGDDSGDA